jgi:hypothetical protein
MSVEASPAIPELAPVTHNMPFATTFMAKMTGVE